MKFKASRSEMVSKWRLTGLPHSRVAESAAAASNSDDKYADRQTALPRPTPRLIREAHLEAVDAITRFNDEGVLPCLHDWYPHDQNVRNRIPVHLRTPKPPPLDR
jgi:hypothetical protein